MSKSYEYFNNISSEMISCATNATLIKRNGYHKRALEIWEKYPKPGHPFQLIAFGKLYILLDDVNVAKMNLLEALKIYSQNENLIDDPLKSNCLGCIEPLGYCLRENSDKEIYLKRIAGVSKSVKTTGGRTLRSAEEVKVDWDESRKRMKEALKLLKRDNIWCDGFNKLNDMI